MKQRMRKKIEMGFILLQTLLYICFLTLDLTGKSVMISAHLKFTIIIICFCYALFFARGDDKGILLCMKAALFFTVISDLFLLLLNHYLFGVLTFIIVQQLYGIRLIWVKRRLRIDKAVSKNIKGELMKDVVLRISVQGAVSSIIFLLLNSLGVVIDLIVVASVFYFICILTNTLSALLITTNKKRRKRDLLFAIGMVLFLLCDINVGFFNLSSFIAVPDSLYQVLYPLSSILMWTFYAPAQVLLSLSATKISVT